MIGHLYLRGFLAILLTIISNQSVYSQFNEITNFSVVGDINAHIRPGESIRIVISADARGGGLLSLRIQGLMPGFVTGWESKEADCSGGCELVDTLLVSPGSVDYGGYVFDVYALLEKGATLIDEESRKVRIHVIPEVSPESPFSGGSANEICWQPVEDDFHYELVRMVDEKAQMLQSVSTERVVALNDVVALNSNESCVIAEGLPEGTRFSYYVRATTPSGLNLRSNIVYSVQDQSPPPVTEIREFSVGEDAAVVLRWPYLPDEVSFIERYVVYRKQVNINTEFAVIDTIPYFPVSNISPANYYPVPAAEGIEFYADSGDSVFTDRVAATFIVERLPDELMHATLIKSASQDRWNESDDFLKFKLEANSWLYVAFDYDNRNSSPPDWLLKNFEQNGERIDITNGRLRIFKSKTVFPAGWVTLGGNFAPGIQVRGKDPLMYAVLVQPVEEILPYVSTESTGWVAYTDVLGAENDLNTYRYKVSTIDAVGNVAEGVESFPIIIDLNGYCKPVATQWFMHENKDGVRFSQGLSNSVCIQDPLTDSNCVGFRDTDSLRFQAVRETSSLFDSHDLDDSGINFFDSGWLDVKQLSPPYCNLFELQPEGKEPNFVNGKTYFYRVRSKDLYGNTSVWSPVVDAVPDAFPPEDVTSLSVESIRIDDGNGGCNQLSWSGAVDHVSGIKSFIIYRKDDSSESSFAAIDTIDGAESSYCDPLLGFKQNEVVHYKVGSIDNVGNVRTAENSAHQVSVRALIGPTIQYDTTQVISCPAGQTRITSDSITVFWSDFNNDDIAGYQVDIRQPDSTKVTKLILDTSVTEVICALDAGDGVYQIRVRAFYANNDTTIFSNTITIRKKVTLQGVQGLTAIQDPRPTGNITLSWSHPDMMEIERFEVFAWKQGQPQPNEPTVVLSGDDTQWVHEFTRDNLVGYECNFYKIRAFDCFGLASVNDTVISQYSNRPPTIEEKRVFDDSVSICWTRPSPRVSMNDAFKAIVLVYRDSLNSQPVDSAVVFDETCYTLDSPEPMHNYFFRVREIILSDLGQNCADVYESGWSGSVIVPFKNLPPAVSFDVQALPVLPDASNGNVFISWLDTLDVVDSFLVKYMSTDMAVADSFQVVSSDTLLVTDLDISKTYTFNVIAIDSLDQQSPSIQPKMIDFMPRWLFTPKVVRFSPKCFRDNVTIEWAWIDENLEEVQESFGADSVIVQLSTEETFDAQDSIHRFPLSRSYTFSREVDYSFVNGENSRLYARVRAKDRWGHDSPWSTSYVELGSLAGNYDEVPPEIVNVEIDSVKAPLFGGPGLVNVHLSWTDISDNCSGTWFYEILRGDSLIAIDTSRVVLHTFVDRGVRLDSTFLGMIWQVHAVDSVGNRQELATPVSAPFTVSAPDSGWCDSDSVFCWTEAQASISGLDISYYLEGARFVSLFGNPLTNVVAGPLDTLCYLFEVPWDSLYWRVKARAGDVESAWSDTFFCDLSQQMGILSRLGFQAPNSIPDVFDLQHNYPNPFNPSTTIRYAIPASEENGVRVLLEIYNVAGQRIRTLVNEEKAPSFYTVVWDGRDEQGRQVGSGIYFYRIRANKYVASHKMILVK